MIFIFVLIRFFTFENLVSNLLPQSLCHLGITDGLAVLGILGGIFWQEMGVGLTKC
jgi:hypothetical protein